jgi:hypothetical protein
VNKLCEGCREPLLGPGRTDRRYHGAACRKLAFRRRQREREVPEEAKRELSEVGLVEYVARGAETNWRAAAWLLERRYPERWGPGAKPESAVPRERDPFAEIDELAVRRRRPPARGPDLPSPRPPDQR